MAAAKVGPKLASSSLPGPTFVKECGAPAAWLVKEYVRLVGADPAVYRNQIPPHLFPQWAFPALALAFESSGAPLLRILNAGCTLTRHAEIPLGQTLTVSAQLLSAENKGRFTLLTAQVATGVQGGAPLVTALCRALVPTPQAESDTRRSPSPGPSALLSSQATRVDKPANEKPSVPHDAREIALLRFPRNAGKRFADLTGDYNPIHWFAPYARVMGYPRPILHGFGALAWTHEALLRYRLAGRWDALRSVDARFLRPVVLPCTVRLFVTADQQIALGDARGGAAYMNGSFSLGGGNHV